MESRTRALLLLGTVLLAAVTVFAVRQTRTEPLSLLSAAEPQRIGQVTVVSGPAGLTVYFDLLGPAGERVRCDGQAELLLSGGQGVIYRTTCRVRAADFAQVRLAGAQGPEWALLYSFGSLSYRDHLGGRAQGSGQAQVTFTTPRGAVLRATSTFRFPED